MWRLVVGAWLIIEQRWGLTWLTHKRKVDVQAAFIVDEGCITDTVRLNPITNVLAKLEMTRLGSIELV
jgi:hypothetical protein